MDPALQVFYPLRVVCQVLARKAFEVRPVDLRHNARVDEGLLAVVECHTIHFLRESWVRQFPILLPHIPLDRRRYFDQTNVLTKFPKEQPPDAELRLCSAERCRGITEGIPVTLTPYLYRLSTEMIDEHRRALFTLPPLLTILLHAERP